MPELHRHNAGKVPALSFMEVNLRPHIVKKLKEQAAAEGLTLTACLVPFLTAIATGRLPWVPHYSPAAQQKVA
jgi:hypothetical protein